MELVSAIVKILVLDLLCLAFSMFKQYLVVRKIEPNFTFSSVEGAVVEVIQVNPLLVEMI